MAARPLHLTTSSALSRLQSTQRRNALRCELRPLVERVLRVGPALERVQVSAGPGLRRAHRACVQAGGVLAADLCVTALAQHRAAGAVAELHWRGGTDTPQRLEQPELGTLRPEALFAWPGTTLLQLLSDDGGIKLHGKECKKLRSSQQGFRSLVFIR